MSLLSVVIPTYNERQNLEQLVERLYKALGERPFELIIVDDASPDGTGELADKLALTRSTMKVIHRTGKLGRGTGFVEGMRQSIGEIICIMDADLQHPPEVLPAMVKAAEGGADLVVASRYIEGGGEEGRTAVRGLTSRTARWLSHLFLPQTRGVTDTQSGFFLFHRNVLEGVELDVKGFTVLVEVLALGKFKTAVEVPYTFNRRAGGDSKLGAFEILGYVKQLLRLSDYRVVKFTAVGASGVLVNNGILYGLVASGTAGPQVASIGAIEASIIGNFLLNNLWTFRHRKGERFHVKLAKYHASVAVGASVNYAVLTALHAAGMELLLANTIGILLGFLLNYTLSEQFVWKIP